MSPSRLRLALAAMVIAAATTSAQAAPKTDEEITTLCKSLIESYQAAPGGEAIAKIVWDQCWAGQTLIRDGERRSLAKDAAYRAESARRKQEEAAAAAIVAKNAEDPVFFVPALSALACDAKDDQRSAKAAIAEHRALARRSGGGVIDLQEIDTYQFQFKQAEQRERAARAALKARGKVALACASPKVRPLLGCTDLDAVRFGGEGYAGCLVPEVKDFVDVLGAL